MKTDVITIRSDLQGTEEALRAADKFCAYNDITGKNAKYIRLLTEETVSMVHGIMDGFKGKFWLETSDTKKGKLCMICVSASKGADLRQEEKLLNVSTSGKNESAKGVMGKIREAFRVSLQHNGDGVYINEYGTMNSWYEMGMNRGGSVYAEDPYWSLMSYRQGVEKNPADEEADELEQSIIGRLADDVKVWLRSNTTEVVIEKLLK